jgi:hypothetical protein
MPKRSGIVCPTASVFSSKAQTNKPDTQSALTNEAARAGAHTETTRRCSKDLSELSDRALWRFGYLRRCRIVGSRCVALPRENLRSAPPFGNIFGECHHFDLTNGWIRLEPGETKNGEGRNFPLTPRLSLVLERQINRTEMLQRAIGQSIPWLFHRMGGRSEVTVDPG